MAFDNLAQLLHFNAHKLGNVTGLRYKRHGLYHDLSWHDYHVTARGVAASLIEAGVRPGDRVGLLGENSADWLMADMAILYAGAVTVSPHAPLTARQVHFQFADAGVVWAFVSNSEQYHKLDSIRAELPNLRGVVSFQPMPEAMWWQGFRLAGWQAMPRMASELDRRLASTCRDDLAAVMYTSGTTGNPKGVMLTHGNLLSNAFACLEMQSHQPDDVVLSWLPYTHIYARTVDHYTAMAAGSVLALAESAETMVDNLAEIRPTHVASVPRFYEKLLAALAALPLDEKRRRLKAVFGNRLVSMSSGGAPLPVAITREYLDAGLMLLQGYGLTESSPVIAFSTPTAYKVGTVGRAIPGVAVKIAEDGEILTRGPHVMKGYWKQPEATAEVIRDGWLHTGDLGTLDAEGFLTITGRKKEMMVLSNGKKVAPPNLEGLLVQSPLIDQAVVIGEGRNYLTALIVPVWSAVKQRLGTTEIPAVLADRPDVVTLMQAECDAALADLSHMERLKRIALLPEPFSVAGDEMTVSLKLRRGFILKKYAERIERLYQGDE
ncbi:MAG: long-chain fatty acid--CoA ligase [Planctomycetia bacterium]|nr:long-chain fatty acid--CoA ligase [Planctomycetia bacterium]